MGTGACFCLSSDKKNAYKTPITAEEVNKIIEQVTMKVVLLTANGEYHKIDIDHSKKLKLDGDKVNEILHRNDWIIPLDQEVNDYAKILHAVRCNSGKKNRIISTNQIKNPKILKVIIQSKKNEPNQIIIDSEGNSINEGNISLDEKSLSISFENLSEED